MYRAVEIFGCDHEEIWREAMEDFTFQGFDAIAMRGHIKKLLPNNAERISMIYTALLYVMTRGTKWDPKDLLPAGKQKYLTIVSKLGITKTGKQKGPNVVSFGRLQAAYPEVMYSIMKKGGRVVGAVPLNFPRELCFPSAPALIPRDETGEDLWEGWCAWNENFTAIINPGKDVDNRRFGEIARNSDLIPDDVRHKITSISP
jgi:hypothetical protein